MPKATKERELVCPDEMLSRAIAAVLVFKRYAPRASVAACALFMEVARRGLKSHFLDLPTHTELAKLTDTTLSGVSHLIAALTHKGRPRSRGTSSIEDSGYGLIETNDWLQGRRLHAYVLTDKGRACLQQMVQALAGDQIVETLRPHDLNSLFKLMIVDAGGRND